MHVDHREIINRFFAAYAAHDRAALQQVLAEDATWTFPGTHPLAGTKVGIDAIVAFFDAMGQAIGSAHPTIELLVTGTNEHYSMECQHIRTQRAAGPNLDQRLCVLWTIADGKIIAGQHLAADQAALDAFFAG